MDRCDSCGKPVERPLLLPLCGECAAELGLGSGTRDYLIELLRDSAPPPPGSEDGAEREEP